MNKLKTIAGITWALAGLILIIILFPGLNGFSGSLAKMSFMKINPNLTGGEVATENVVNGCTLAIRRPVFDGLIREKDQGFVQIDWRGKLPETINDTIDYNKDDKPDFVVGIKPADNSVTLLPLNPKVRKMGISTPTSYGWAVRVIIDK